MQVIIVGRRGDEVAEASRIATARGARIRHLASVGQAMDALRRGPSADLMLLEVEEDIAGTIRTLLQERIHLPVVAYGVDCDARSAVAAIRAGAKEFVPLPPDAELIAAVLEAVAKNDEGPVFDDPATVEVFALARQYAPADASVLITGESGTGKEVMARHLHAHSRRAGGPFVSVNCAAIPENLLESELFGHEKGAFTGATARRIGKFEEANGGTLLLDEISEMDVRLQAKLLRAIQEREIDRVGGTRPVRIDIRLIATSNRDLEKAVEEGSFREDLLFRLAVLGLHLPPLRARPRDIETLARHFMAKYAAANMSPVERLSPEAVAALRAHHWRGNVRELENCMHRAVLLADGDTIEACHVRLNASGPRSTRSGDGTDGDAGATTVGEGAAATAAGAVGRTVAEVERDLILHTLDHTLGNRTHAATILGISIRTLRNKLKQYADEGARVRPAHEPVTGGVR